MTLNKRDIGDILSVFNSINNIYIMRVNLVSFLNMDTMGSMVALPR